MTPDPAGRRAKVLADIFARTSRTFLAEFRSERRELALDLGCGPGYSTRLLARGLGASCTIGMDSSGSFLRLARSTTRDPTITFLEHDVTVVPFPAPAADVIYGRFLLAHLAAPGELVAKWVSQLRRGGILLLDEGEWIHTTHPALQAYLEMLGVLLQHQGRQVDVAGNLEAIVETEELRRHSSRLVTFSPMAKKVAEMFRANLQVWRDDPFIEASYGDEAVHGLESELRRLEESSEPAQILWGLRQVAFERR